MKVEKKVKEKILFNNVIVCVNYSEVFVIVGLLGLFKIMFLDVLVGRIEWKSFKGNIFVNGKFMGLFFKWIFGYVM